MCPLFTRWTHWGCTVLPRPPVALCICQFMQSVEFFSFLANALRILSSQCCPNIWGNIAQEYMCNVGPKRIVIFLMKNQLMFHICLVVCYLSRYNITEQSWLFLLDVGLGVHLWLVGQHWTWTNIDWNHNTLCYSMEQWFSGYGAGFPIQGSCVQNQWVAPRLTQPFILPRSIKWVPGISGNLVVKRKLPPWSGSSLEAVEPHP